MMITLELTKHEADMVMFGLFAFMNNVENTRDWYEKQKAETPYGAPDFPHYDEINDFAHKIALKIEENESN